MSNRRLIASVEIRLPTMQKFIPTTLYLQYALAIFEEQTLNFMKHLLFAFGIFGLCQLLPAQNTRDWGTFYGGGNEDWGTSVATDRQGNVYLAGKTSSTSAIASGGFQNTYGGGSFDAYLVKFDASGTRLWATYYGGAAFDEGTGVCTDDSGNVYLAGKTQSTSGIAAGGFQNTFGGVTDAFLVKFNSAGNRIWATYYGGSNDEQGGFITCDKDGDVYLAGFTGSFNNIASNGFQNSNASPNYDGYVVRFTSSGSRVWGTFCGGSSWDYCLAVAVDKDKNVFIAGYSNSHTGIGFAGYQDTIVGVTNAFLVKIDSSCNRVWGTYYGTLAETGWGVAVDSSGDVYLSGIAQSSTGIAFNGFQNTFGGAGQDAMLVKFDSGGHLLWATYYGGTGSDRGFAVAVDSMQNVFMSGTTLSNNAIAFNGFQNTNGGGTGDAFLVGFTTSGNRLGATYYGGLGGEDDLTMIALDNNGHIFMGGYTDTVSTAIASGGFQNTYGGGVADAYLVKFTTDIALGVTGEMNSNDVVLAPDPADDYFNIASDNPSGEARQFIVYNSLGQPVITMNGVTSETFRVECGGLAAGYYTWSLTSPVGVCTTGKLIIQ